MSAQSEDGLEPLVTECPYCRTRFRVSDQQLVAASGRVRCGACLQVFQGNAHLLFESEFDSTEDASAALDELLDDLGADDADHAEDADDEAGEPSTGGLAAAGGEIAQEDSAGEIELVDWTGNEEPPTLPEQTELEGEAESDSDTSDPEALGKPAVEDDLEHDEELLIDSASTRAISQAVATARAGLAAGPDPDVLLPDWEDADREPNAADDEVVDPDLAALAPELTDVREVDSLDELDALLSTEDAETAEGSLPAEGSTAEGVEASGSWARFELVDDEPEAEVRDSDDAADAAVEEPTQQEPGSPAEPAGAEAASVEPNELAELLRDMESPRRRNWLAPVVIVGVIALVAEVLYLQFDQWSLDPTFRPIYAATCSVLPCELEALRDVDAIRSLAHEFRPDPDDSQRMMLDLQFVSDAEFAQPFPTIEVTFRARTGALISTQSTPPEAYLHGDAAGLEEMMPKTPVRVTVVLNDVPDANYRIRYR